MDRTAEQEDQYRVLLAGFAMLGLLAGPTRYVPNMVPSIARRLADDLLIELDKDD